MRNESLYGEHKINNSDAPNVKHICFNFCLSRRQHPLTLATTVFEICCDIMALFLDLQNNPALRQLLSFVAVGQGLFTFCSHTGGKF